MDLSAIRRDVEAEHDNLVNLRRVLHRKPEVGLSLPMTQATVLAGLEGLGLEISVGRALSSVTAVLRGGGKGPAVLLRGDMDALPVAEETKLPFSSEVEGVMHACGHDLHTAMLVGAAKVLTKHRKDLPGDVVFMFQPGEEGHNGAHLMIEEGVLDAAGPRVSAAYGVHVKAAGIPRGVFTTRPGPLMAANANATIVFKGGGGHGSAPHLANDPIPAAAALVGALQTMVTRKFNIFDPVVITVGVIHAGTQNNIIPESASVDATIRTFSSESRGRVEEELSRVCKHVALSHGVEAEIEYRSGYPVTNNDPEHAGWVRTVLTQTFGADKYEDMVNPLAGSEDFSYVLQDIPGCYVFLGAESGSVAISDDNHSPRALFDESVLVGGVVMHTVLAMERLRALSCEGQRTE